MEIEILQGIDGARRARGLAVVIDVFRAFSTACYAFAGGAESIIPVARTERAFELKWQHPEYLLMGERNTYKLPGFDYGNSPAEIEAANLRRRTIVHTTSAGTQGLVAALDSAEEVVTGAFVNASAVARYAAASGKPVSLVAMGTAGTEPSDEDTLCAKFIRGLMRGNAPDFGPIRKRMSTLESAIKFFDPAQTQAPQRDFELCTRLDAFDFVLAYRKDEAGLARLIKLNADPSD